MTRILIAGFGNVLRGDDAFGVEVIRRLETLGIAGPGVELMEVGTGGIRLAQELLSPCCFLIIADAMTRGGAPGDIYVLEVDSVEQVREVDMHVAIPSQALSVAQALGVLPPRVVMVGCEPAMVDELCCEMSPVVVDSVDVAVAHILRLVGAYQHNAHAPASETSVPAGHASGSAR